MKIRFCCPRSVGMIVAFAVLTLGCTSDGPTMSQADADLVAAVEQAGGRVMIGFKDSGTRRGVDDRGRVIASDMAVSTGTVYVRGLGGTILYGFEHIPAVIATIDPSVAPAVRRHANVDYIEAALPGSWLSADSAPFTTLRRPDLSHPLFPHSDGSEGGGTNGFASIVHSVIRKNGLPQSSLSAWSAVRVARIVSASKTAMNV